MNMYSLKILIIESFETKQLILLAQIKIIKTYPLIAPT